MIDVLRVIRDEIRIKPCCVDIVEEILSKMESVIDEFRHELADCRQKRLERDSDSATETSKAIK